MTHRNILFLFVFMTFVPMTGCVSTGPFDDDSNIDFRLRGKIGVRGGPEPNRAFSASFDWTQADDMYVIELWGPFGQGRTRLVGDDDDLTITDARGTAVAGVAPETLMDHHLGWSAPVGALRHWILGRLAPGHPATREERDAADNLVHFEQLGWLVQLSRWREVASFRLPGKATVTHRGRRITIICREWRFR